MGLRRRQSEKPRVIEFLFEQRWDPTTRALANPLVSSDDVVRAIEHCNARDGSTLSTRNPANFMKDIVRGHGASANWPQSVLDRGFTGKQVMGEGLVFEFVPLLAGQMEAFPDKYRPSQDTPIVKVQSVSIPLAAKKLGRSDEAWLIQVALQLRLIETHLATQSSIGFLEITHLQMSVKLRKTEIDALLWAQCEPRQRGKLRQALITCEAKRREGRVLEDQIRNQVAAAFEVPEIDLVVPIALRAWNAPRGVYIVEFRAFRRSESEGRLELELASDGLYELVPNVKGI